MADERTLSGRVAILTRNDGLVMATAADFDPKSPGYSNEGDAQASRARQAMANAFVREFCGQDIADVIKGWDAERLVNTLCERKGYRVTVLPVGDE